MSKQAANDDDHDAEVCQCGTCKIIRLAEETIPELKGEPADQEDLAHETGIVLAVAMTALAEAATSNEQEALEYLSAVARGMFHAYTQQTGKPLLVRLKADFLTPDNEHELMSPQELESEMADMRGALREQKGSTIH